MSSAWNIHQMNMVIELRDELRASAAPTGGEDFDPKALARSLNQRADELQALDLLGQQERSACFTLGSLRRLVESKEKAAKAQGDGGLQRDMTGEN